MQFQVTTSTPDEILILTLTGEIADGEGPMAMQIIYDTIKKSGLKRILIDNRQVSGRGSVASTFFDVRNLPGPLTGIRIAMLNKGDDTGFAAFSEATGYNVGLRFRLFSDEDTALSWLRSG
ncbi:hypothetical protein JW916_12655 [Candidatus Sumerlaeota bacterium]|nr:hypothetical protein [Candidatus Sumerlaeota bacterium]